MRLPRVTGSRRRTVAVLAIAAAGSVAIAGTPAYAAPDNTRLGTKMAREVTVNGVNRHLIALQRIAAQNGGTRASGTPGYDISAKYVHDKLAAAGWDVSYQDFPFPFYEEKAPPESRYPKIADGTLVRREALKFPDIPVFRTVKEMSMRSLAAPPERVHQALRLDFGPQWKNRIIAKQPPSVGKPFPALVPQVDQDGNDLGGVRLPQLEVPLATYTGWNLRDPKIGMPDERVSFLGSFFPLPKTKADAEAAGDPRRAIAERYATRDEYLAKFRDAAMKLADERFLLHEDVEPLLARGAEEWEHSAK